MSCSLGHTEKSWCLDCKFAKEGLCDYPHKVPVAYDKRSGNGKRCKPEHRLWK